MEKRPNGDDEQPTQCDPELLEWVNSLLAEQQRRREELLKRLGDVLGKVFDGTPEEK